MTEPRLLDKNGSIVRMNVFYHKSVNDV